MLYITAPTVIAEAADAMGSNERQKKISRCSLLIRALRCRIDLK